ncbi:MAG: class I SAM-dependent RNA methyltransferase [Bacteroidetes bacterium]|nr:class I SAM-dependent RNA methyltransferase [Bacteroidota bacterium]
MKSGPKDILKRTEINITAKCFFGFEETLADELTEFGFQNLEILNRAVRFKGSWKDIYFLNLHCRCAISILVELDCFEIFSEKDLYDKCMKVDWTNIFDSSKSFAIKGAIFSSIFQNTHYPFLLVKDAIVDTFRNVKLERPNVDVKKPHVSFDLYIKENLVTLSLNTSGLPLFQRGYRQSTGEAPLNEVVAACLIRLSGWNKKTTFLDPFCGSGTLLIEAALYASGIPSNIERQHYAFKNLKNYEPLLWQGIYDSAKRVVRELPAQIIGGDISDEMVLKARRNLRTFSFGRLVKIQSKNFKEFQTDEEVFVLTNPPYGERIEAAVELLYGEMGSWLKHTMTGSEAWVISGSKEGLNAIGLKPEKKYKVFNGDLECSFRQFKTYQGSLT